MPNMPPLPIFVYGTLQRGQERAAMWPRPPRRVEPARIRGRLYDLGPYPALVEGQDLVCGELWHFERDDLAATLAALDEIEGYGQGGVDLYVRRVIECWTAGAADASGQDSDQMHRAYTYYYARLADIARAPAVVPDASGLCRWRRKVRA